MRLHLYAVNGKTVPAKHRAVYLWSSMLFFTSTSISGASIVTKRNIVSETISFTFIVLCSDIFNARYCTSEPGEHYFGDLRGLIREFTTLKFAQLVEKLVRRLNIMYKDHFCPTRSAKHGYQATRNDFFNYSVDKTSPMMEGTITIDPGDYVAAQVWPAVQQVISYSLGLMTDLFATLGARGADMSPFSREFTGPQDLRDEFIRYMPRTFEFDNIQGIVSGDEEESELPEEECTDQPTEAVLLERVKRFSVAMLEKPSEEGAEEEDEVIVVEQVQDPAGPSTQSLPATFQQNNNTELMTNFRNILSVSSAEELGAKVLLGIASIEGRDATVGTVSFARRAKSLVERWLAKSVDFVSSDVDALDSNDVIIERDTILLVNVKVGRGATAANVACLYRVMEVYEKYYNKWFMSKQPFKKWKKEPKPYKLRVRMLRKNVVNEYADVDLVGDMVYGSRDICRTVDDGMIVDVVGKLDQVVM